MSIAITAFKVNGNNESCVKYSCIGTVQSPVTLCCSQFNPPSWLWPRFWYSSSLYSSTTKSRIESTTNSCHWFHRHQSPRFRSSVILTWWPMRRKNCRKDQKPEKLISILNANLLRNLKIKELWPSTWN